MVEPRPWTVVANVLAEAGCLLVTGLPADEPGLLDAAEAHPDLRALPVRDQRVAACAAIGHSAVSGRPAVLAVNSGPSFTNTLTGLLEGSSLGSPIIVITTRVPVSQLGRGGFQQVDQRAMIAPLVKWSTLVETGRQLGWALRRAVHLAVNGTPGITLVEISDEVLRMPTVEVTVRTEPVRRIGSVAAASSISRAGDLLSGAVSPVIVVGGGGKAAEARAAVRRLAENLGATVFTTASGRGAFDEAHPLAGGLIGLYASASGLRTLTEADVVLVVGSRLEETARMGWETLGTQLVIHLDCDPNAFGKVVEPAVALLGDAAETLAILAVTERPVGVHPVPSIAIAESRLTAESAFGVLAEVFGRDLTLVQENGLHDLWGYQHPVLSVSDQATIISPGEQTMVGFGLGAALGASVAAPGKPVVLACGDGAFEMSINAIPSLMEQRCGVTVMMFDNRGFGWPRLLRDQEREPSAVTRFPTHSHADAVVSELGGWAVRPTSVAELRSVLEQAYQNNLKGEMVLVGIGVHDDDVPPGVRRELGIS